ncbi:MAG: dihydroneopterin aldolase [Alphaproteobacteria bacterium]
MRDLVLLCRIGVKPHERETSQRVRINVDLHVAGTEEAIDDDIRRVVSYEGIVAKIRRIAAKGPINLVETLADRIAEMCLSNRRVESVRVRVEKLDVFDDALSVGTELERTRASD